MQITNFLKDKFSPEFDFCQIAHDGIWEKAVRLSGSLDSNKNLIADCVKQSSENIAFEFFYKTKKKNFFNIGLRFTDDLNRIEKALDFYKNAQPENIKSLIEAMENFSGAPLFEKENFDSFDVGVEGAWLTYGPERLQPHQKEYSLKHKRPEFYDGIPNALMLGYNFNAPYRHWIDFDISQELENGKFSIDDNHLNWLIAELSSLEAFRS